MRVWLKPDANVEIAVNAETLKVSRNNTSNRKNMTVTEIKELILDNLYPYLDDEDCDKNMDDLSSMLDKLIEAVKK